MIHPVMSVAQLTASDVEAAYLYNFGKFVNWPAEPPAAPFSICVLGDDFAKTLDSLIANESIQGRKIAARRLSSVADADRCQILFLGVSEESRLTKDMAALKGKPILTVSSLPRFLDEGGNIQFLMQNNRVRFAINLAAAEKSGLTLSSELLKVAVSVSPMPPVEGRP
jgi:hypothetical protein